MAEISNYLSTASHWDQDRSADYNKLSWVKARGLLDKITELADLRGGELVVDAGTGSQIILDRIATDLLEKDDGLVIGFDMSLGMIQSREGCLPPNARLVLADFCDMPFPTTSVDVITARQVLHNLPLVGRAITEAGRVLREGGKFIGVEYVATDDEVLDFERTIFDIKEPGRNLWTGEIFKSIVEKFWGNSAVTLHYFNLEHYSVGNWMENSGLSRKDQQRIIDLYHRAPESIVKKMNLIKENGDILTDRLFAHIVAVR